MHVEAVLANPLIEQAVVACLGPSPYLGGATGGISSFPGSETQELHMYLLLVKSLFIGVLRSNLSTARPFPRVHCRPVPLSKPHAEALLTR